MTLLRTALVLSHVVCMLSWIGAMYFNLLLLFPMYRSRPGREGAALMREQGTRAAPLLYLLIGGTAASGGALAWLARDQLDATRLAVKSACLVLMLGCHLWGSLVLWPRVFLALDAETDRLFAAYRLSMFASATAGTAALIATYFNQ